MQISEGRGFLLDKRNDKNRGLDVGEVWEMCCKLEEYRKDRVGAAGWVKGQSE